jgi:tRNA-specific 2-thiouridylase
MQNNTVTVGPNEALFATTLLANDFNWIPFPDLSSPMAVTARARYNQKEQPATVYPEENGYVKVVFHQPQRAMTPGQAAVFYEGDHVLCGGTIERRKAL